MASDAGAGPVVEVGAGNMLGHSAATGVPDLQRTVLVTRPQPQADEWVAGLRAARWPAAPMPLLQIAPAPDPERLRVVHAGLRAGDLLMFVSPNAASQYLAAQGLPMAGFHWPEGVLAAATGPGTVAVLREAGLPSQAIIAPPDEAPQFDSEALWALLSNQVWVGRRAWVVRGEGGRDWLSRQLTQAGAQVQSLCSYRRLPPDDSPTHRQILAQARQQPDAWVWLFSSSECIQNLVAWVPEADWTAAAALVTHPRIAQSAQQAGFGQVRVTRPDLASVQAALNARWGRAPPSTIGATP